MFKEDDLKKLNYMVPIAANIGWLKWLGSILSCLSTIGSIMKVISPAISRWLRRSMQDLVIYTSSDVRCQNYAIRQQVLGGAVEEIKLLLEQTDCQIIVVGHSLGSVIAYDALNRMNLEMNIAGGVDPASAKRIAGLVTFGSPLDKVYFFFREPVKSEKFVQRMVLSHLHGYKSIDDQNDNKPMPFCNPIKHLLDKSIWLNFYHIKDFTSGNLDAYKVDLNVSCDYEADAHVHEGYWSYTRMYNTIAEWLYR